MDCCNYMPYQRQQHYYSHQHHHHHHHHHPAAAQPYPTYQRNQQQHQQALQHQYPQQQQQQQQLQLQQHQFNQQQRTQQYCYEAAAYSPYDPTMSSSSSSASATSAELCAPRYASPAAPYATDYVYNPKEARLRKAMRDQTRSTITAATTTAAATANNNNNNSPSSLGVSLLEQQQQRMQTSSLMVHNNGNGSNSGAAINRSGPWFPAAATAAASTPPSSKSAYSPKHRTSTLDDKSKDGSRKQQQQQQDCSNQGCYPGQAYAADYHPVRLDASSSVAHQAATPPADYCSYNSGNLSSKWYPYQNGASNNNNNAYHSRNTLMSKINGYQQQQLRAAQQQQQQGAHAMRPLAHSAWGQFCNMPYQPNQSVLARANRHMFYLQEQYHQHHQQQQHQYQHQQQQQHRQLDYADGATAAAQMQSAFEAKMQDELARRLHATPPQEDSQSKNPLAQLQLSCSGIGDSSPKYCSSIIGASGSSSSLIEEAPRWSTPRPSSVSSSSCTTDTLFEREEPLLLPRKPSRCSKPLPGFQQAFGSTEIGKFSRSELFASLIEAAAAATSTVSTIGGQGDYGSSSSPEMDDASTSSASQQQQLHQGSAGWHAVGGEI
ncbi:hypothetical protein TKK_0005744 [Trichogramma kaykai]|uniref:Uncharacterized protein n=1 Tax=Trichogramma kaykai TaxID=54128 RepID=A0ABD2XHT7_9HYME